MTVHMTIALTEAQKEGLDELARQQSTDVEEMVSRIVEAALDEWPSLAADVEEARADYRAGRFVDHDVVVAESEARYAQPGDASSK